MWNRLPKDAGVLHPLWSDSTVTWWGKSTSDSAKFLRGFLKTVFLFGTTNCQFWLGVHQIKSNKNIHRKPYRPTAAYSSRTSELNNTEWLKNPCFIQCNKIGSSISSRLSSTWCIWVKHIQFLPILWFNLIYENQFKPKHSYITQTTHLTQRNSNWYQTVHEHVEKTWKCSYLFPSTTQQNIFIKG